MSACSSPMTLDPPVERETLPPSGTVTLLFTDIEGSTQLWEAHAAAMRAALARHDTLRTVFAARHWEEIRRQIAALKAACPARNSAGPPRISHAVQADAWPDHPSRAATSAVTTSAAAATMIPATMIG